jgi:hypothetical protein
VQEEGGGGGARSIGRREGEERMAAVDMRAEVERKVEMGMGRRRMRALPRKDGRAAAQSSSAAAMRYDEMVLELSRRTEMETESEVGSEGGGSEEERGEEEEEERGAEEEEEDDRMYGAWRSEREDAVDDIGTDCSTSDVSRITCMPSENFDLV